MFQLTRSRATVVDGKDAKVKLISANEDQRKGTGAYTNFKVKDPATTFYVPYKVELYPMTRCQDDRANHR